MSVTQELHDVPSLDREGVVYHVRRPKVDERTSFRVEIGASGAEPPNQVRFLNLLADSVKVQLSDESDAEQRERHLTDIEAHRKVIEEAYKAYREDDNAQKLLKAIEQPLEIRRLIEVIVMDDPILRRARSEMDHYLERVGLVAARMFLMGWSGLDEPFTRKLGRVEPQTLEPISRNDLVAIGMKVQSLAEPSKAVLGNSPSDAGTPPDQPASEEASDTPKPAQRQKAKDGSAKS